MLKLTSGLSRYEIQKARQAQAARQVDASLRFRQLPILLLGLGLSFVTFGEFDQWLLAGLVLMTATVAGLAIHLFLHHYLVQMQQATKTVTVVRSGLLFVVPVSEVVAGDVVVLHPGEVVAVDLVGEQAQFQLAPVLAWLLQGRFQTIIPAGAVVKEATTAVVAAHNQRAADQVVRHLNAQPVLPTRHDMLDAFIALVAFSQAAMVSFILTIAPRVTKVAQQFVIEQQRFLKVLSAFLNRMSLVGHVRHHDSESAFRYNQDPVSWRLVA